MKSERFWKNEWRVPLRLFWVVRQKIFNRKSWFTPMILETFWYTELVEQISVLPRKVSVLWDKKYSTENLDTPNNQRNFDTKAFLKHIRVPLRILLVLWDKKFSTKNSDTPLLCLKIFDTPNYWNNRRFPREKFRYRETKTFLQKRDTPNVQNNFDIGTSLKLWRVHLRTFLVMRDQVFSTETLDIPLLFLNFFDTRN